MDQQQEDNTDNIDNANNVAAKSRSPIEVMRRYIESLPEEITFKEEITSYQFWKAVRTEFLATLLFIIFGCGPCLSYASLPPKMSFWSSNTSSIDKSLNSNLSIDSLELIVLEIKVSLVFGLTSATLIQCMGQVSGCHLTPAISLSLLVTRRLTILRCLMYIFAQCIASIVACGILYGLLTTEERLHSGLGLTLPNDHLNASQAFGYEFLATFIVVLAYLVNSDPQRTDAGFKSLSIGFAYSVAHFFSIYWIAPLISGMLSGFTYEYIRSTTSNECQTLKRSFRRKQSKGVKRDASSNLSNYETEFTITSTEFPRY